MVIFFLLLIIIAIVFVLGEVTNKGKKLYWLKYLAPIVLFLIFLNFDEGDFYYFYLRLAVICTFVICLFIDICSVVKKNDNSDDSRNNFGKKNSIKFSKEAKVIIVGGIILTIICVSGSLKGFLEILGFLVSIPAEIIISFLPFWLPMLLVLISIVWKAKKNMHNNNSNQITRDTVSRFSRAIIIIVIIFSSLIVISVAKSPSESLGYLFFSIMILIAYSPFWLPVLLVIILIKAVFGKSNINAENEEEIAKDDDK